MHKIRVYNTLVNESACEQIRSWALTQHVPGWSHRQDSDSLELGEGDGGRAMSYRRVGVTDEVVDGLLGPLARLGVRTVQTRARSTQREETRIANIFQSTAQVLPLLQQKLRLRKHCAIALRSQQLVRAMTSCYYTTAGFGAC